MTPSPFELDRIPRQGGRRSWPSSLISTTYTQLACSPLSICGTNAPLTSAFYPVPLHLDLDHLSLLLPSGSPGNNAISMSDKPISRTASGTREVPEARAAMKYSGSHHGPRRRTCHFIELVLRNARTSPKQIWTNGDR